MNKDKSVCIALQEAIRDERAAPPMYKNLIKLLGENDILTIDQSSEIRDIIAQEEEHERKFIKIAEEIGCSISTKEPRRKEFYELPLKERVKMAREFVKKSY